MNILLTGHRGLIGSYLKEKLEKEGHKIIGFDIRCNEQENVCEIDKLKLNEKVDMLIHAAAHCKINQSISDPKKTFDANVLGTHCIFEFARKNNIKKIVYFSSSRVLSKEKNPYTSAKLYGEELCKAYKDCYGIEYIIIRPSTVYGPFWDETKRLMHIFITNALQGKDLEIYGNPDAKTLDFTYIDDFIDATMLAINHKEWNRDYDISGEQETNIYELAKFIIENTENKSKVIVRDAEIAQPQQVKLSLDKIKALGYKPHVSMEEGVKKSINWYREFLKNTLK
jgi:nucleoside-diphosphate-sugar epimerase